MKLLFSFLFAAILLVLPGSAASDFYRYLDPHGNVVFTDDLSKVPPDQRPNIQHYESSQETATPLETDQTPPKPVLSFAELGNERRQLLEREKSLNQAYDALIQERTDLENEKEKALSDDQVAIYNQKIVELNTRIQAYEEKRAAYAADMKAFNQRVEAWQAQTKTK